MSRSKTLLIALSGLLALNLASGCPQTGSTTDGTTPSTQGVIQLPATGQTTSYATGDDGDDQTGTAWPSPRFTDNGDGTITDQLTGLTWLTDADCLFHHGQDFENDGWDDGMVPWADALLFIARINDGTLSACAAGYNDWRLPNVVELESLVDAGQAQPSVWLTSIGFTGVQANDYWTSTTDPDAATTFAYLVDLGDGGVSRLGNKPTAPGITHVWPVRGTTTGSSAELWKTGQTTSYASGDDGENQQGTAWPSPRFTDNGDGTVTDNLTGWMWLQDAATLNIADWQGALILGDRFNNNPGQFNCENYSATYTDWRVPNRKELFSLADFSQAGPALPADHPFIGVSYTNSYWSSTSSAADTDRAWHVDLRSGEIGSDFKVNTHLVLLVR